MDAARASTPLVRNSGTKKIEQIVDLRMGEHEIAHEQHPNGVATRYDARCDLIKTNVRQIHAFDVDVVGEFCSMSLGRGIS